MRRWLRVSILSHVCRLFAWYTLKAPAQIWAKADTMTGSDRGVGSPWFVA